MGIRGGSVLVFRRPAFWIDAEVVLLLLTPCLLLYAIASYCTGRLWPPCALLASMPLVESALTFGPQKISVMHRASPVFYHYGRLNLTLNSPTSLDTQSPAAQQRLIW